MPEKLEILYPRKEADIKIVDFSKEETELDKQIKEIKEDEVYKKYERLIKLKDILTKSKNLFTCWNCGIQVQTQNLTLYNFVSISDGPDENRYEDYNIICPSCGKFSYLKKPTCNFKNKEEVYK
jgi:5-methylcytosine-specific restriction endonuclease McrA